MPVSRKRKKTRKSGQRSRPETHPAQGIPQSVPAAGFADFTEFRRQLDEHRASIAAAAAKPMIATLAQLAAARTDSELEDELCAHLGRALAELDAAPTDDYVAPNTFAEATVDAAATAVATAISAETDWSHAWRLLNAVAGIMNYPVSERASGSVDDLRTRPGATALPEMSAGPTVTGPVLWARDAYGSRFAIAASFRATDGPERWYLWDVDACGHAAFTVHSRYHATLDRALADWQAAVGSPAFDGAVFVPVDDPHLLEMLMPRELGMLRPGGENVEQFAEYHRSKRLAEAVLDAIETAQPQPMPAPANLDAETAATLFAAWSRNRRPDPSRPEHFDDLVTELANSWQFGEFADLYHTCSPHRVALVVEQVRGFYEKEFAADLIALLPDWTAWLAERNTTPTGLADRCRPYAYGEPHKAISADDGLLNYLARVTE